MPAPQWLFLKRLLYSFSILNSGRQSASLTQRLDLLYPERASWSLCYGRFIAPCSKERLQSHASPCTHLLSSSLPAYIDLVLFPYRFRIVSASGSENDRRMIGERYGINTGLIRDRYGIHTRSTRSCFQAKRLIKSLISPSIFICVIFYILPTHDTQFLVQRQTTLDLPRRGICTKITSRPTECKPISMN